MQDFLQSLLINTQSYCIKAKVRKLRLEDFCLLRGPPHSGKTTLALMSCREHKTLFIDWQDFRVCSYITAQSHSSFHRDFIDAVVDFCRTYGVVALIFKHIPQDYSLLPLLCAGFFRKIIIISNTFLFREPFREQVLMPLDFEEFLSFGRIYEPEQSFNAFVKEGNLPQVSLSEQKDKIKQNILKIICCDRGGIFTEVIPFLGQRVSIYQLFSKLKSYRKISKDTFYNFIHNLCKEHILFFVSKFEVANAPKKMFFWDFSLKSYISFERDFITLFTNCVFLELLKRHSIFYGDKLDFIVPSEELGIMCIPFATRDNITAHLQKITKEREFCAKFLIITLELRWEGIHLGSPFYAMPFWEFALGV